MLSKKIVNPSTEYVKIRYNVEHTKRELGKESIQGLIKVGE